MAWWLFQNLVVTAGLAVLVTVICRTLRPGPVVRHAMWVLVLLKFVMPPIVAWPWAVPDPFGVATVNARQAASSASDYASLPDSPLFAQSGNDRIVEASSTSSPIVVREAFSESRELTVSQVMSAVWPWALGLWALGSAILLVFEGIRISRLVRAIKRAVPTEPAIVERAAALAARFGLRPLPILTIREIHSPMIWCVGRPRLLWPASLGDETSDACVDGLLVHELAHVKRRDHFVGWIELAASIVWWWNPCFWYVRSALREQAELACDAWVISALPNGRRAYAESLLALSGAAVRAMSAEPRVAVIGIRASNRRVLERRLVMIMKGRAPLRLSMVGLFSVALMAGASIPVWATASQQTTTPPQTAPVPVVLTTTTPAPHPQAPTTVHPTVAVPVAPRPVVSGQHVEPTIHVAPRPLTGQHGVVIQHTPTAVVPVAPAMVPPTTMSGQHMLTPVTSAPQPMTFVHQEQTPRVATRMPPVPAGQTRPTTPAPQSRTVTIAPPSGFPSRLLVSSSANLPAEGQELSKKYDADRAAIQKEIDDKLEARRQAYIKQLTDLQEQYTKAGKLDEALAIRDYIRAGAGTNHFVIRK